MTTVYLGLGSNLGDRVAHLREAVRLLAPGVRVKVLRSTITSVLAKPDPAAAREAARDKDRESAKEKESVRREAGKV